VGGWVLRSLSVAFWGDGRVSESFLSKAFFSINALLSLQENKNSSQRMKVLLNGQSTDRKLIETHVLSPYAESPSL
jgi:hypothetical protein